MKPFITAILLPLQRMKIAQTTLGVKREQIKTSYNICSPRLPAIQAWKIIAFNQAGQN
jgi:hypothetical protein